LFLNLLSTDEHDAYICNSGSATITVDISVDNITYFIIRKLKRNKTSNTMKI